MTEAEEALLFAMQAGDSAALTPSAKLRANLRGEDKASSEFYEATETEVQENELGNHYDDISTGSV